MHDDWRKPAVEVTVLIVADGYKEAVTHLIDIPESTVLPGNHSRNLPGNVADVVANWPISADLVPRLSLLKPKQ